MKVLALIPARGGSKRIPNKNMQEVSGRPLIYYSIQFAKKFGRFNQIVVSSDDHEILDYSVLQGVDGLMRPDEFSSDLATTGSALAHCLNHYESLNKSFDVIVTLQPTNPFRSLIDFEAAFEAFEKSGCDSMFSVSKLRYKFGTVNKKVFIPQNYSFGQRGQEMNDLYFETGQWYFTRVGLAKQKMVVSNNNNPWICCNWFDGIDIDEPEDLEMTRKLMPIFKTELGFL